jgi:hypothetical protein
MTREDGGARWLDVAARGGRAAWLGEVLAQRKQSEAELRCGEEKWDFTLALNPRRDKEGMHVGQQNGW